MSAVPPQPCGGELWGSCFWKLDFSPSPLRFCGNSKANGTVVDSLSHISCHMFTSSQYPEVRGYKVVPVPHGQEQMQCQSQGDALLVLSFCSCIFGGCRSRPTMAVLMGCVLVPCFALQLALVDTANKKTDFPIGN